VGEPENPEAIAASQASLVGLPIADALRQGTLENLARLAAMAALVKEFAVPPANDAD
jgi:hypothetical protein